MLRESFLQYGDTKSFFVDMHSDLVKGQQFIKARLGDADLDLLVSTSQEFIAVPSPKCEQDA